MQSSDPGQNPRTSITRDRINDLVERGDVYTVQNVIEGITRNSTVDLFFDLSEFNRNELYLIESIFGVSSGSAVARFYLPGDFSGGTELPDYNRNELSNKLPQVNLRYKTDGLTTPGSELPTAYQIGGETNPAKSGAGAVGDDFLTRVDPSISRLLRFVHEGNAEFNLDIRLVFAEIP